MARKKSSTDHFREVAHSIRSEEERKAFYYLYGEESFFHDLLQEEVVKRVDSSMRDFNLDILYGNDTTPARLLDIVKSFPMMAPLRVVIVRDISTMRGQSAEEGNMDDLIGYLENPNPTTLLFLTDRGTPDKRTRIGQVLTKSVNGFSCEFKKLPDYQLPDWVTDWADRTHGKKFDPEASQMVSLMAGNDLTLLASEIEKICTFAGDISVVGRSEVKSVAGSYRDFNVFELKEAVLNRDTPRSIAIGRSMMRGAGSPAGEVIRTLAFLYSLFSNIWQIRRLSGKGLGTEQVRSQLGVKSKWYFEQLWKEANRFQLSEIPGILEAILDADNAVKGGSVMKPDEVFLMALQRICKEENHHSNSRFKTS
ncbi:MAG: DNA polymerase III subunit delta [Balneolaceae bacterium]